MLHYFASVLSAVPLPAFPCLTLTSGWYLIVSVRNRSVAHTLQLQFFELSVSGVHDLPVTTHCSHYMKCHLKCLVIQIVTSDDLMIPLNFKSMDCSLSQHINTLEFLRVQFSDIKSLTYYVLIHWTFTGLKEKMSHTVFAGFFSFHCNVGSVMAMPKIC